MNVKEAARAAAAYVEELFAEEGIEHIGLEEVTFDDLKDVWNVTIGFYRELDRLVGLAAAGSPAMPRWR